ncbi:uncharacterized protein LOC131852785 [Achroia grisella]|uniref:uncharacterized protein LOC131852785 n=1 Tax=Achroia grisella TaxID=688607 RepID=UPI0027D34AA6|nr:uncharacterized protein LOC131852785 [Achroia grisella]XP_059059498.1 uncharacterized protein LOC131852785 [Achroia grisella]
MPPTRQVSDRQLELMVDFVDANRKIILATNGKSPYGQRVSFEAWDIISKTLNDVDGGLSKTPEKWKRYWHLLKCRTKAKAADIRRNQKDFGGGSKPFPLSELEKKIISILRKAAVEFPEADLFKETEKKTSPNAWPEDQTTVAISTVELEPECQEMEVKLEVETTECEYLEPFSPVEQEQSQAEPEQSIEAVSLTSPDSPPEQQPPPITEPVSSTPQEDPLECSRPRSRNESVWKSRHKRHYSSNLPRWAYDLEERRIATDERRIAAEERRIATEERRIAAEERRTAAEERVADAINGLRSTNMGILGCMQQFVQMLRGYLNKQ